MADELVIEDGCAKTDTGTLHSISDLVVRADGVITIDCALALFVKAAEEVESVVGHEASAVEELHKLGSKGLEGRLSTLVLDLVDFDIELKLLVKRLDISDHTCRSDDTGGSELTRLGVVALEDAVAVRDTSITRCHHEVLPGDCCTQKFGY